MKNSFDPPAMVLSGHVAPDYYYRVGWRGDPRDDKHLMFQAANSNSSLNDMASFLISMCFTRGDRSLILHPGGPLLTFPRYMEAQSKLNVGRKDQSVPRPDARPLCGTPAKARIAIISEPHRVLLTPARRSLAPST